VGNIPASCSGGPGSNLGPETCVLRIGHDRFLLHPFQFNNNLLFFHSILHRSRVSSGSIVSDYGLDDRAIGVRSPAGAKDFSSILCVQTGSGAQPPVKWVPGVLSPGVKARPGRDADRSPPSSVEVENE
jgi:hypothetical protein